MKIQRKVIRHITEGLKYLLKILMNHMKNKLSVQGVFFQKGDFMCTETF